MTNIGYFHAARELLKNFQQPIPTHLWMSPPIKIDEAQFIEEGYYSIFGTTGVRTEMLGCSLCMGNQAHVVPKSTVVSTCIYNFLNRLGQGANVYLASAELAAINSILGYLPTTQKYHYFIKDVKASHSNTYRYLNFDQLPEFVE